MIDSAFLDALQIHGGTSYALRRGTSGFGTPAPRRDSEPRPRRHGERDRTRYYAGRVFNLRGYAKGTTSADAWAKLDALKAALALGDAAHVLKFTRTGFAAERAVVRVASELLEDELGAPRKRIGWSVQLVAEDPRIYADVQTFTAYFLANTTPRKLVVTNNGNYPTPPVWRITAAAAAITGAAIVNLATGERLKFSATIPAASTVFLDVDARSITLEQLSGSVLVDVLRPDLLDAAGSVWSDLPAGASSWLLVGQGFGEATTNLLLNGGFETNTNQWVPASWTLTRDTTRSLNGSASCFVSVTAAGGFVFQTAPISGATTGRVYTGSVWIYASGSSVGKTLRTVVRESGGAFADQDMGFSDTVLVQGWQLLSVTGAAVIRNDRTGILLIVEDLANAMGSGVSFWMDDAQVELQNHPTAYLETNGAAATRTTKAATLEAGFRDARI